MDLVPLFYLIDEFCQEFEPRWRAERIASGVAKQNKQYRMSLSEILTISTLKGELGSVTRFQDLAELYEGIAMTIYCYNHRRIHTALRMSPAAYGRTAHNGFP